MARPTIPVPNWADGGSAVKTPIPDASKRAVGWLFQDPPPFNFLNWFWNALFQWVFHLSLSSSKFDTLHAAVNALAVGDTAIVDEWDGANFPGETLINVVTATVPQEVSVSGRSVAYNDGGGIKLVDRADLTTDLNAAAFATTIAFNRVITDGVFVIIAGSGGVEAFDHDAGGAPLWTHVHGATVNDIAMDGTHVYLVGDSGTGAHHARALLLSTGAIVWSYDHDANLEAVATTGRQVFVAGAASGHASGATMRALDAADGFDVADEGGTGLSGTFMTWDLVDANGPTVRGQLAADRRGLLVVGMSGGTNRIQIRDAATGASIRFLDNPGSAQVEVDQRFVYGIDAVTPFLSRIIAWDKATGARVWVSGTEEDWNAVRSDGAAVFITAALTIQKVARGNRARIWRRVDPADDYLPARQLIVPED